MGQLVSIFLTRSNSKPYLQHKTIKQVHSGEGGGCLAVESDAYKSLPELAN